MLLCSAAYHMHLLEHLYHYTKSIDSSSSFLMLVECKQPPAICNRPCVAWNGHLIYPKAALCPIAKTHIDCNSAGVDKSIYIWYGRMVQTASHMSIRCYRKRTFLLAILAMTDREHAVFSMACWVA